jgi:hypothetical protein
MDYDILPDMGRMTARLRLVENYGRSTVRIAAASERRSSTASSSAKMNDIDPQAWLADVSGPHHGTSRSIAVLRLDY